jgi:PRTRC genetic system protein F
MLFDPRSFVPDLDAGQPAWVPSRQHFAARRRPAHDFLTLPSISAAVPVVGRLTYGDDIDVTELVRAQFAAGVVQARHVSNPRGAGDAFAQALFAWLRARTPQCNRLSFSFALLDKSAATDEVMQFGREEGLDAPLYLGIQLPGDEVYAIGGEPAIALRDAHPSLLFTAMSIINAAAGKSLFIRTPAELLEMFARWNWDYDSTLSDDDTAREFLKERYGEEDADIEHYLPSVVRAEIAPDDVLPKYAHVKAESKRLRKLKRAELIEIATHRSGWLRQLCMALAELHEVTARQKSSAIEGSQWAEPAYSASIVAYGPSDYIGQLLDDHYDCLNNAGDATMFQCFIPIASKPAAIRKQFKALEGMLRIIGALDRVLTLLCS